MRLRLKRAKTELRRQQIVEATLALLADSPLDQLSTRQIARELGVTQPALFRHFASRDALLLAVIAASRDQLGQIARGVLEAEPTALGRLRALAERLLAHVADNPGLPRLLFANVAGGQGPVLLELERLYSMQSSLVAELVREGQRAGSFDSELDARDAATLFAGAIQGVSLQRRLHARPEPLVDEGRRVVALWLRALGAREPTRAAPSVVPPAAARADGLVALDVRPYLARGVDPLDEILRTLERVGPGGVLVLDVPFRPVPLLTLLEGRGHRVRDAEVGPKRWTVEVIHSGAPEPEDLRELEAPEPMQRVLEATQELAPGGVYLARVPRHPRLLLPELEARGLAFAVHVEPDESALLRVYRPS